jgi:hypothetical protein
MAIINAIDCRLAFLFQARSEGAWIEKTAQLKLKNSGGFRASHRLIQAMSYVLVEISNHQVCSN